MARTPKQPPPAPTRRRPNLKQLLAERGRLRLALAESSSAARQLERERRSLQSRLARQQTWVPPGHFYSPITSPQEIEARADEIWGPPPRALPGIDLREEAQLRLLSELAGYYREQPFADAKREGLRYHFANDQFSHSDAIIFHCLLRHLRPRRLYEIGSGYSSAVALDTDELFLGGRLACTFVEPHPERLLSLMKEGDGGRVRLVPRGVQTLGPDFFSELAAGDILFVDSTHVSKAGSDVNHILFRVLPRLAAGVLIHFHDVFYPFVYPREWELEGRAWNEAYLLRAFLQYNRAFEVYLFPSFLQRFHADWFAREMPLTLGRAGASLWLRKL